MTTAIKRSFSQAYCGLGERSSSEEDDERNPKFLVVNGKLFACES